MSGHEISSTMKADGAGAPGAVAREPMAPPGEPAQAPASAARGFWSKALHHASERISQRIGRQQIPKLLDQRERVRRELRAIPERMQKITNQASLVLDMVDDYAEGRYRAISFTSLAIAGGALLYSVSPGDVVPDVLPVLGQLDDALVIGVAMRLIRRDLRSYCEFKGYDPHKYF
jgi:uncharacterized membrane protein YkvA (DUF1232 family)